MDSSSAEFSTKGANHKVRKLLGRAYLRENRIPEALEVYLGVLKDSPNDLDVLFILGNLYRLSGSPAAAGRLYHRVLELSPGDRLAEKHAAAVHEAAGCAWDVSDVLSAESIDCLVKHLRLRGEAAVVEEIRSAAEERTAESNGQPVEDVEHLMPALIEQNIRQARAAGYPDLAEALQSLQINLARQVDDRWADDLLREERPIDGSGADEASAANAAISAPEDLP